MKEFSKEEFELRRQALREDPDIPIIQTFITCFTILKKIRGSSTS